MTEGSTTNLSFTWTTKQRRCYQRIKSGLTWHKNEILRFLTLGSAPNMKCDQQKAFRKLKLRLGRLTLSKLYDEGYITKDQLITHYSEKPMGYVPQLNYVNIRTTEGPEGVLHILYFGDFIPQSWLKETWYDLTGTCRSAYIKMCKQPTYNENKLARYCVSQYCTGQTEYLRFSYSKNWVYPGFVRHYRTLKADCTDYSYSIGECFGRPVYPIKINQLIDAWNDWLNYHGTISFSKFRGNPPLETEIDCYIQD